MIYKIIHTSTIWILLVFSLLTHINRKEILCCNLAKSIMTWGNISDSCVYLWVCISFSFDLIVSLFLCILCISEYMFLDMVVCVCRCDCGWMSLFVRVCVFVSLCLCVTVCLGLNVFMWVYECLWLSGCVIVTVWVWVSLFLWDFVEVTTYMMWLGLNICLLSSVSFMEKFIWEEGSHSGLNIVC